MTLAAEPPPETEAPETPAVDSPPPPVRRVVLRGIKFGSDTAYIEPASAGVLELVAERLRENPELRVRIEGYTDEQASEEHNLELSQERAEAVKRILVGFGIAAERLDAVGLRRSPADRLERHPGRSRAQSPGRAGRDRVRAAAPARAATRFDPVAAVEGWGVDRVGDRGPLRLVAEGVDGAARDVEDRALSHWPLLRAQAHAAVAAQHHHQQIVAVVAVRGSPRRGWRPGADSSRRRARARSR